MGAHQLTTENDQRFTSAPPSGGWKDFFYSAKFRSWASQIIVLLLLLWGLYIIVQNTQANLARLNKNFGFDFLGQQSGFDLSTALIPYSSTSTYGRALLVGFYNTALVAVLGIIFATILGFILGGMRLSKNWIVSRFALGYVELVRNIPLLVQIFVWYALVLKPLPGPKLAYTFFGDSVYLSNRGLLMPHPTSGPGAWLGLVGLAAAIACSWFRRRRARRLLKQTGKTMATFLPSLSMLIVLPVLGLLVAGWPLT